MTDRLWIQGEISQGDFFGELAALLPPSLAEHRVRTRTAYATGETHLGVLDYDDVSRVQSTTTDSERTRARAHLTEGLTSIG